MRALAFVAGASRVRLDARVRQSFRAPASLAGSGTHTRDEVMTSTFQARPRRSLAIAVQLLATLACCAGPFVVQAGGYRIQPGDVLMISVWKEPDLQREVLVRPDGGISFPLAGDLMASGLTVASVRDEIAARLERYIPEPVVTVEVRQVLGNKIYVIGKVNRPGEFVVNAGVDVVKALSMAGGTTPFASLREIKVLRRGASGIEMLPFDYADIEDGVDLEQNVVLQSGDVVVVP